MKILLTTKHVLLIVFLTGLLLRLLGLFNITLAGDFAYHWSVAREIVVEGRLPLLGPTASVNTSFHLGPFYYYLLALPYALGNGNFRVAIAFFSLINSLSIIVLFKALRHWFSESVSLKIIVLYAVSAYFVRVQNFPWNPYLLPALISLMLFCVAKIRENKFSYVPALALTLGFSLQAHATALFLVPVVIALLPIKKIPLKASLLGVFTFLLSVSPWLYVDVTSYFSQTKEMVRIFAPVEDAACSLGYYLQYHGNGERCFGQIRNSLFIVRFFTTSLFTTQQLLIAALFFIAAAVFILKVEFEQKKFLLLWVGIPWFLYLFYSSNVYLHYFLIFFPIPFIVSVLMLEYLAQRSTRWKTVSDILFYVLVLSNIGVYLQQLNIIRG